tara:strand:- start:756 stop:1298 length:543 start_codon:yes stop_codon:yes gene_type:complete
MKYVIPLILILIIGSCKQRNTAQNMQLDELLMELQNLNDTVSLLDTSVVLGESRIIKSNLKLIHEHADTINVETASIIAEVYEERNKIFFVEDNYKSFTNELTISTQQLNKLKQDLNNGLLTDESFNTYYEQEKSIILNLNQKISESYKEAKRVVSFIQKEDAKIDSLITYLKEEKELNQ